MLRYLETFFRHRLLLMTPILLALAVSLGFSLSQPRLYEASASVWYDATPLGGPNSWNAYTTPADSQAAALKELLQTRNFTDAVGYRSQLAEYLRHKGTRSFWDPVSKLFGRGSGPTGPDRRALDQLIFDTINRKAVATPIGPQVLAITFDAPDATVAAGTTQAIVDQFFEQTLASRRGQAQTAVDFYSQELKGQPAPLPGDTVGRQQYDSLFQKLMDARLQLAAQDQPSASGFRLLDAPLVPDQPKAFKKALLFAGLGGMTVGVTLSLILLMLFTWSDGTLRRSEQAERALGGRVVIGSIPRAR